MKQFDIVTATFQPKILRTLKPGAEDWIGWKGKFSADWIIEDGVYKGQWAMGVDHNEIRPPFCWVPEEDLEYEEDLGYEED